MSETPGIASLHDVDHDREGTRRMEARLTRFFARPVPAVPPTRGRALRGVAVAQAAGRALVARCPAETQARYQTLLHYEAESRPQDDYGLLIAAGCQVMEAELERRLFRPAREVAGELGIALAAGKHTPQQVEVLQRWEKGSPPTIGTGSLILLALRRGWEQRRPVLCRFLEDHFTPPYLDLLAKNQLAPWLDRARERFRNPACHGYAAFDAAGYTEFVRLLVARERFGTWDVLGPEPTALAEGGVLHHHLVHSRTAAETQAPAAPQDEGLDHLRRLAREDGLLRVVRAADRSAAHALRDLGAGPEQPAESFRLGDQVQLVLDSERPGHLLLLDQGTSGAVYCLCPSRFAPDAVLPRGRSVFPQPASPLAAFSLTSRPGREQVLAILSDRPLGLDWMPTQPGAVARLLTAADVQTVTARLCDLPAEEWVIRAASFDVLA